MKKPPVYNPLAMSSKFVSDSYGKAWMKYDKANRKKQLELNRINLKK